MLSRFQMLTQTRTADGCAIYTVLHDRSIDSANLRVHWNQRACSPWPVALNGAAAAATTTTALPTHCTAALSINSPWQSTSAAGPRHWTLSVMHTENRIHQFLCVCVCYYSSQTTGPIRIKITLVDRTYHDDCYMLVRFELFTTSPLKFIQKA